MGQYNATYHLTRGDVRLTQDYGMVRVKAGKNLQQYDQLREVTVYPTQDPRYCVIKAMQAVIRDTPTLSNNNPMFMFPDTRQPVPMTFMNKHWAKALKALHIPTAPFSLHSLRKAAATEASRAGWHNADIQKFGGWASDAYKTYICTDSNSKVQRAIGLALH